MSCNVDSNISEYINNVYLKLDTNIQEEEDCLIILLNYEDLSLKEKNAIIQKVETKISKLSEIETQEVEDLLLENSKLQPNWSDIITRFVRNENVISESVITFLNNNENAEILSKQQIPKEPDESVTKKISKAIILNEDINNESYTLLLKSVPYYYRDLDFENMSNEKVKLLLENNKLGLSQENYNRLRENFVKLHTALIEKREHELSDNIDNLEFDDDDIIALLKSSILSVKEKHTIIATYDNEAIITNIEILGLISTLVNSNNSNDWDKEILKAIITNSKITIEDKITLFNITNHRFEKNDIMEILQSLPEPYSSIVENGKRPLLPQNAINTGFANVLKIKKYIKDFKPEKGGMRISTFRK